MLLLTWPILRDPAHVLLCDPTSEAMGHLWGLEVADEGLFRHGPFVRVTDQVGFPDGFQATAFDRFSRSDPARTRATGGAGLGLSIARGLVEAHGGEIWIDDVDGAQVSFRIPAPA